MEQETLCTQAKGGGQISSTDWRPTGEPVQLLTITDGYRKYSSTIINIYAVLIFAHNLETHSLPLSHLMPHGTVSVHEGKLSVAAIVHYPFRSICHGPKYESSR
jgi:hypothetical protein